MPIGDTTFNPNSTTLLPPSMLPSTPFMPVSPFSSTGSGNNPTGGNASAFPGPSNFDLSSFGDFGPPPPSSGTSLSMPSSGGAGTPAQSNPFMVASPTATNQPASQPLQFTGPPGASGMTGIGKGLFAQNPIDPALTSQFFQWLQSQIGQGVPGFDLSTILPSTGKATQPGQLNAPLNPLMQMVMGMFQPGGQMSNIGDIAQKGISAIPAWQSTVDAMQKQIGEGAANLREQFGFAGNLDSSPFGQAMTDYQTQSNKDLNSLLANMTFQGVGDQLQAANMVSSTQTGVGEFLQGLDQQSIQNMLQEFIRTSPQYNPLLGMMFGGSTTFPPVLNPTSGVGGLGALLGGGGSAAAGLAQLIPAIAAL